MDELDRRDVPTGAPAYAIGSAPGSEPRVWLYDSDGAEITSFLAYESTFTGGVRVAVADLNGDDTPDIATAPGPGGGPRVRAFDGDTGGVLADFMAYETTFLGGVWIAAGPIGSGAVGIATGADAGGGPRVRVFDDEGIGLLDFLAFDKTFTGGVRIALGQIGSGPVVYAVPGAGLDPLVRGYAVSSGTQVFEQEAGPEGAAGGTFVATGDLDDDGADDLFTLVPGDLQAELRAFRGSDGLAMFEGQLDGTADGIGVLSWNGQRAIAVLGDDIVTAYELKSGVQAAVLGERAVESAGGPGSSLGGLASGAEGDLGAGAQVTLDDGWTGPFGDVTVTSTVTLGVAGYPSKYMWEYHVHNVSFFLPGDIPGTGQGFDVFDVWTPVPDLVMDQWDSLGLNHYVGMLFGDPNLVSYQQEDGTEIGVLPGGSADFKFYTPPAPIAHHYGEVWDAQVAFPAAGQALAPDEVKVIITDKNTVEVTEENGLKVAKWSDAFSPTVNSKGVENGVEIKGPTTGSNYDFIDRDDDRFNVWVYDKATWDAKDGNGNPVNKFKKVKISTKNTWFFGAYNDAANEVDMVRFTGTFQGKQGWFWSDSQMLVSNEVDDGNIAGTDLYLAPEESGPAALGLEKNGYTGGSQWHISDRTHKVALGGRVKAEYDALGLTVSASAPVKVVNRVKVHVTILRNGAGGNPVISEAAAKREVFYEANEQYAQVGVKISMPNIQTIDPPTGVSLNDGLDGYPGSLDINGKLIITNEESALLVPGHRTQAVDDIELYYVNFLKSVRKE